MGLKDIKLCTSCSSMNLVLHPNLTFETVKYNHEEESEITTEVLECLDCNTLMWYEDENLCRQYLRKEEQFIFVPMVADMELINK